MNIYLFSTLLSIFIIVSIYVGTRVTSSIQDQDDYYLSGRSLGIFSLSLTFLATQLGGGAIVGAADAAFVYGWQAIYYALGISIGLIILALGIGRKLREKNISTIPQIFESIYEDKFTYKLASIVYIISTFLILVAIAVATKKYLIAIGFYHDYLFLSFWCALIIYTSLGGLKAVVQTDIIQIFGVLIIFAITAIYLLMYPTSMNEMSVVSTNSVPWSSWLLMPLCFTLIGQDMGQRCFSGASAREVSISAMLAGIILVLASLLPTYLGILARTVGIDFAPNSSVLITVINEITNPTIATLFSFAVLMAIISTADSLLCAISSNIAIDIFSGKSSNIKAIPLARIVTFVSGIFAFIFSLYLNDIIQLMVKAYELTIVGFFIPIIMGIYLKEPPKLGARLSVAGGILSYVFIPETCIPKELACLFVSFISFILGLIIAKTQLTRHLK